MRLVTYEIEHKSGLGVISRDGSWVYPLASLDMDYKTMQELIENISESEKQLLEYASGQDPYKVRGAAPIGEVSLLARFPIRGRMLSVWESITWLTLRNRPDLRRKHLTGRDPMPSIFPSG